MRYVTTHKPRTTILSAADEIARTVAGPHAAAEDAAGTWPGPAMHALGEAGLLGLHVPVALGGLGEGLYALATISEVLGRESGSAAMCYAMHCVATAVIAIKPSDVQRERYLVPIAEGRHVTTLALSEPGTGSHFYTPQTQLSHGPDGLVLTGVKSFITNGGHADSYVVSVAAADRDEMDEGVFSCLVVDAERPGLVWDEPWNGFGLRANSSRTLHLNGVPVPATALLGSEGDQMWYVFEVVAPYFLTGMAGTYLGIAQAAFDIACEHLASRRYAHTGELLGSQPYLAGRLGRMWRQIEQVRQLLYSATMRADAGDDGSLPAVLACKAAAAELVVETTNEAMVLCGGIAYRANGKLTRLVRDAQASHIMGPTTEMLNAWIGRAFLGLPLLG